MAKTTQQRFLDKIELSDNYDDDCWYWTSTIHKDGYGEFKLNYKQLLAHRVSYELFRNKIPNDKVIDHLCRNRICVNPNHLEVVTFYENLKRGIHMTKNHCKNGHDFNEKNTRVDSNKHRHCRVCEKISQRKHRSNLS